MNDLKTIGSHLAEHSKTAEFTARGAMGEFFPFVYVAAKRMSVRAISKWLKETHNIKISHVTISKALNNPDEYIEVLTQNINTCVQVWLDYALDYSILPDTHVVDVLYKKSGALNILLKHKPSMEYMLEKKIDIRPSIEEVRQVWMPLPEEFKMACRPYFMKLLNEKLSKNRS